MKIEIIQRKKGDLDPGLIFGGIGFCGFLGARYLAPLTALVPPCPLHHLTGIPCPTCGSTRSGLLLSRFQILEAFRANPLFVLVCIGVAGWGLIALVLHLSGKRMKLVELSRSRRFIRIILIGIILLNWVYLIITEF